MTHPRGVNKTVITLTFSAGCRPPTTPNPVEILTGRFLNPDPARGIKIVE